MCVAHRWLENKSKNEKYVVTTIHNASSNVKLFLNSYDFTEKSETALLLTEVVNKAVEDAREMYNVDIYAVGSDNASTMISMGKRCKLWHTTCDSHSGNLLAKSLVEKTFTSKFLNVSKEFKSSLLERQLVHFGGRRIQLPGDTRWCSYCDSYRCCLQNLSHMKEIINEERFEVTKETADMVFVQSFEDELLHYIIIFDVICELLNKCQQDDFTIADSLEEWLSLKFPVHNENYECLLKTRLEKVIKPICLAANILIPKYKGKVFVGNKTFEKMAEDFFQENLSQTGLKELSD